MGCLNFSFEICACLLVFSCSRSLHRLLSNLLSLSRTITMQEKQFALLFESKLRFIFKMLFCFQFNYIDSIQLTDSLGYMAYHPIIKSIICCEEHTNNVILVNPVVCTCKSLIIQFYCLILILLLEWRTKSDFEWPHW